MFRSTRCIAGVISLVLVAGPMAALADPGNGKGQGNSKGNPHNAQGAGNKGKNANNGDYRHGPTVDRSHVIGLVGGYRDYWQPGPALPPESRRIWRVANRCLRVLRKNSTIVCSATFRTTTVMNGSKPVRI